MEEFSITSRDTEDNELFKYGGSTLNIRKYFTQNTLTSKCVPVKSKIW